MSFTGTYITYLLSKKKLWNKNSKLLKLCADINMIFFLIFSQLFQENFVEKIE